jgi:hypothetical protein
MAIFAGLIAIWAILSIFWPDTIGSFQGWSSVAGSDDFRTMAVTFAALCFASLIPQSQGLYALALVTGVLAFLLSIAVIYVREVNGPDGYEVTANVVMFISIGLLYLVGNLSRRV